MTDPLADPSYARDLTRRGLIAPPPWLPAALQYETVVGSRAFGTDDANSDMDVYGWAVPPREVVFPHLRGEVPGYGEPPVPFNQYAAQHVADPAAGDRSHDITIYSVVFFLNLARQGNVHILDALFAPADCLRYASGAAGVVRADRRAFLTKAVGTGLREYALTQLRKMESKKPKDNGRAELVRKHGYDTDFAYHCLRLLGEAHQILSTGDLDLRLGRDRLREVRRGEWPAERVKAVAREEAGRLDAAAAACRLPDQPDDRRLRQLLYQCLEEAYGSLAGCVTRPTTPPL